MKVEHCTCFIHDTMVQVGIQCRQVQSPSPGTLIDKIFVRENIVMESLYIEIVHKIDRNFNKQGIILYSKVLNYVFRIRSSIPHFLFYWLLLYSYISYFCNPRTNRALYLCHVYEGSGNHFFCITCFYSKDAFGKEALFLLTFLSHDDVAPLFLKHEVLLMHNICEDYSTISS